MNAPTVLQPGLLLVLSAPSGAGKTTLAHRLLKNGQAGSRAYILLTDAALRWVGVSPTRAALTAHIERYEHFGEVRCFVRDLGEDAARAEEPEDESAMEYAFAD